MIRVRSGVALCLLISGCSAGVGAASPTPVGEPRSNDVVDASTADAAVSDASQPLRDPTGRWSCDLLGWNGATQRFDPPAGGDRIPVTVARSPVGISWRLDRVFGLDTSVTIPLVEAGAGWRLEGPFRNPLASPSSTGRVDSFDVGWRDERIFADMRGTFTGAIGPTSQRSALDCGRAP